MDHIDIGQDKSRVAVVQYGNELAKLRRDGIPMLAIVITDGVSNYADTRESSIEKTLREAVAAREKDIKLISIGVGNNPDDVELVGIAGDKDQTLRVDDY